MGFYDRWEEIESIPIKDFNRASPPTSLVGSAWRLSVDWEAFEAGETIAKDLAQLLAIPGSESLEALVIGPWEGVGQSESFEPAFKALIDSRGQLPHLKHLFLGEILQEESEVSWIQQTDVSAVFPAFPNLETLVIRGGNELSLGKPSHERLKKLVIETGGLPASVVDEICSANLPELAHLELWLGSDGYGNNVRLENLKPLLTGSLFPKLNFLGLRNDEKSDETAQWLKDAVVLKQLSALDLSLGTFTDEGAKSLCEIPALETLKGINLYYNFMTDEGKKLLAERFPNVAIEMGETQEADEYDNEIYRYNFVSE